MSKVVSGTMNKLITFLLLCSCTSLFASNDGTRKVAPFKNDNDGKSLGTYVPAWYIWRQEGEQLTEDTDYGQADYIYLAFMFLGDGRPATPWQAELPNANPYILTFHEETSPTILDWIANKTNAKVMLSIGGWTHETRGLSTLISSPTAQDTFLKSLAQYMKTFNIHGIDWDWEYPGDQTRGGQYGDNFMFPIFLEKVKNVISEQFPYFEQHVTVGIHPKHEYNKSEILRIADRVNLMTYDMYGNWDQRAKYHNAPWVNSYEDVGFSISEAIEAWIGDEENKQYAYKISVGLNNYGRGQGCENLQKCKAKEPGIPSQQISPYSKEVGVIDYYEILDLLDKGVMELISAKYDTKAHAVELITNFKGKPEDILWWSIDDENTLCVKTQLTSVVYGLNKFFFWHMLGDRNKELENSVIFAMNNPMAICPKMENYLKYPKVPPAFVDYLPININCSIDKEHFAECIDGKLCPEGIYFDKNKACEIHNYNCREHTTPECNLLPVVNTPTKFIACVFDREYILQCPQTLKFEHSSCACVYE